MFYCLIRFFYPCLLKRHKKFCFEHVHAFFRICYPQVVPVFTNPFSFPELLTKHKIVSGSEGIKENAQECFDIIRREIIFVTFYLVKSPVYRQFRKSKGGM